MGLTATRKRTRGVKRQVDLCVHEDAGGLADRMKLLNAALIKLLKGSNIRLLEAKSNYAEGCMALIVQGDPPLEVPDGKVEVTVRKIR